MRRIRREILAHERRQCVERDEVRPLAGRHMFHRTAPLPAGGSLALFAPHAHDEQVPIFGWARQRFSHEDILQAARPQNVPGLTPCLQIVSEIVRI